MAVKFKCLLHVGKYQFRKFIDLKIESTRQALSDVAELKLANPGRKLDSALKVGDPVKIWLGYDDVMNLEFQGYIGEIKPNTPFEIKCEDETWALKRRTVSKNWRSVTLKEVIQYLVPGADVSNVIDVTLAPYTLDTVTPYKALEDLKKDFGLDIYFRQGQLFAGLAFTDPSTINKRTRYDFTRNVIQRKSELVYSRKEDTQVKVKAISILRNGKRIEETVGDSEGEEHTRFFSNVDDRSALRTLAEEERKKIQYDGYKGSFKTWLLPFARHGEIAEFHDPKYPERTGANFIDSITTEVTKSGGCRRTIKVSRRA